MIPVDLHHKMVCKFVFIIFFINSVSCFLLKDKKILLSTTAATDRSPDGKRMTGETEKQNNFVIKASSTMTSPNTSTVDPMGSKDSMEEEKVREMFAQILQDMLVLAKKGSAIRRFG